MCQGRMKLSALAAVASLAFVGYVAAQQAGQELRERQLERSGVQQPAERAATAEQQQLQTEERRAGYRGAGQAGEGQKLDKYLAGCLLMKNQAEIELSQFGQQQAQNPQVKQFAQMLVQEHQQLSQQLKQIAGQQTGLQAGRQRVGAAGQTDTQRTQQDPTARAERTPAGQEGQIINQLEDVNRQITQRCLEMTKEKLQEKQGAEFDKAFLGTQISMHIDSLAALEVIQQEASGQLAQVAQQAAQTVEQHLEQAEQLMQQLEGQQGQRTRTQ